MGAIAFEITWIDPEVSNFFRPNFGRSKSKRLKIHWRLSVRSIVKHCSKTMADSQCDERLSHEVELGIDVCQITVRHHQQELINGENRQQFKLFDVINSKVFASLRSYRTRIRRTHAIQFIRKLRLSWKNQWLEYCQAWLWRGQHPMLARIKQYFDLFLNSSISITYSLRQLLAWTCKCNSNSNHRKPDW